MEPELVTQIKDELRACTTEAQIDEVADRHRETVKSLAADPKTKVWAIHISNLKFYMLNYQINWNG